MASNRRTDHVNGCPIIRFLKSPPNTLSWEASFLEQSHEEGTVEFSEKTYFVGQPTLWEMGMPNGNQYQPTTARRSPHIASAEASNNPKIQQPGRNNLIKHCAHQPANLAISIGDPKKPPFITINTGGGEEACPCYIFPRPTSFPPPSRQLH